MKYPGFIYSSYQSQALTADQEQTWNWYVERMESQGATTEFALYPTPGVEEIGSVAVSPGRGHFEMAGREFAVIGSTFYEIDAVGTITSRGTVLADSNPATISSNGDGGGQLFVTSGGNGYNFDLGTNTLTQIAALNGKATMGGHLDGYFIALDANTSTFYISALLNGTSWTTGTDFAQRSIMPDPWISMRISGRFIWLLGEQTSEVWYNTGQSFPFAPNPSGVIQYGCAAPFSSAVLGRDIIWIGKSREGRANILRAAGFTPEVISNYPIQNAISDYVTIEDAQGDSYSDRGHNFYLLTFPSEDVTWCWDSETGQWSNRGTWISEESRFTAWRPRWHAFAFDEHRILDAETGSVYRMDTSIHTDVDEREIRRLRRAPSLQQDLERVFYSEFTLDVQPGLGTVSGQGVDPQVMMRFSDDGGQTWSSEMWRSAGKIGEYGKRVEWNRLGTSRRRVFEISVTDPIPWRITGAYLKLQSSTTAQGGGE